jgi:hypothetical protein
LNNHKKDKQEAYNYKDNKQQYAEETHSLSPVASSFDCRKKAFQGYSQSEKSY